MKTPEEAEQALTELREFVGRHLGHDSAMVAFEMVYGILADLNEKVERLGTIVLRMHGMEEK